MVPAVTPLRSPSTAPSCARIDSRPDTAKIGSDGRVEVHRARLRAVFGGRKTFPHGLDPSRTWDLGQGEIGFARILAGRQANPHDYWPWCLREAPSKRIMNRILARGSTPLTNRQSPQDADRA